MDRVVEYLKLGLGFLIPFKLCCSIITEIIELLNKRLPNNGDGKNFDEKMREVLDEKYSKEWTYHVIYLDDMINYIIIRNEKTHESHGFAIENNGVTEAHCLNVSGNKNMNLIFTYERGAITEVEWNPDSHGKKKRIKRTKISPDGEIICFYDTPDINDKVATELDIVMKYLTAEYRYEYVTLIVYKDHKIKAVHFDIGDKGALMYYVKS